jgi:hypothetical protein
MRGQEREQRRAFPVLMPECPWRAAVEALYEPVVRRPLDRGRLRVTIAVAILLRAGVYTSSACPADRTRDGPSPAKSTSSTESS